MNGEILGQSFFEPHLISPYGDSFDIVNFQVLKTMKTLTAVIWKEEDMYVAKCVEVGTVSQGKTIQEALENLKEATELYLEEFPEKLEIKEKPLITTFEISKITVST